MRSVVFMNSPKDKMGLDIRPTFRIYLIYYLLT